MGFLGLSLLFAGIAPITNGVAALSNRDVKNTAFINLGVMMLPAGGRRRHEH